MPYYDSAKLIMLTALASNVTHLSLHSSASVPNTSGSNEATGGSPAYARKVPSFGSITSGILPLSSAVVFDVVAGTWRYVGMWNSSTFLGYGQLPIDRVTTGQDTITISQFAPNLNL